MIEQIITSSVLIVCIIVLRGVLGNRISQRVKYALWLLVAVKLLIPLPMYETTVSVMNVVQAMGNRIMEYHASGTAERNKTKDANIKEQMPDHQNVNVKNTDLISKDSSDMTSKQWGKKDISVKRQFVFHKNIGMFIWFTGVFLFSSWFLFCNIRFYKQLKKKRKDFTDYPCQLKLYETDCVSSPCLFGIINPTIYLTPDSMESDKNLQYIIAHELTHYKHKDHIWGCVRCLCLVFYWYHPLVWLAAFLSGKDSELACDEGTIKYLGEENRKSYGAALIEMATGYPAVYSIMICSTSMLGGKSEMKKRIQMIVRKPKMLFSTFVILLILLICVVGGTFSKAKNNEKADVKEQDKIESADTKITDINTADTTAADQKTTDTTVSATIKPAIELLTESEGSLVSEPVKEKVCIQVYPNNSVFTERSLYDFYYIPDEETQKKLKAMIGRPDEKQKLYSNWWKEYDCQELGYQVRYNDVSLDVNSNNILINQTEETFEINKKLCSLIQEIVEEKLNYRPLDIKSIKNIVSAKLDYRNRKDKKTYSQTIKNKKVLRTFEKWFSNAEVFRGGSGCPFTDALLTLTLENGEIIQLSIASDSCPVFMANGVYYDYSYQNRNGEYVDKKGEYFSADTFFQYFNEIPYPD